MTQILQDQKPEGFPMQFLNEEWQPGMKRNHEEHGRRQQRRTSNFNYYSDESCQEQQTLIAQNSEEMFSPSCSGHDSTSSSSPLSTSSLPSPPACKRGKRDKTYTSKGAAPRGEKQTSMNFLTFFTTMYRFQRKLKN